MQAEKPMVKVYKPKTPLTIPQELIDAANNAMEGSSEQHKAHQKIAEFIATHLNEMDVEEKEAGKPKHITTSKLPINTRDKPIGRKDWLHKK